MVVKHPAIGCRSDQTHAERPGEIPTEDHSAELNEQLEDHRIRQPKPEPLHNLGQGAEQQGTAVGDRVVSHFAAEGKHHAEQEALGRLQQEGQREQRR